jgi:ACR3 family arsenite efflux pump ArsB
MIMPSLLDFEIKDFLKIRKHQKLLRINLAANIVITPLIAWGVGSLFFQDI